MPGLARGRALRTFGPLASYFWSARFTYGGRIENITLMPDSTALDTFHLAADPKMIRVRRELEALARNSIRLWPELMNEDAIPVGFTKLGGRPDLPLDVEWPSYHIDMPRPSPAYLEADPRQPVLPEDGNLSLPFFGQFDLAELAPFDLDGVLSKSGMLYLFYNDELYSADYFSEPEVNEAGEKVDVSERLQAMRAQGLIGEDEGGCADYRNGTIYYTRLYGYTFSGKARALYSQCPRDRLQRRDFPTNLSSGRGNWKNEYKTSILKFTSERLLPRGEDHLVEETSRGRSAGVVVLTEDEYSHWNKLHYGTRANADICQMLGYPDMYSHGPGLPRELFPLPRPWHEMSAEEKIARGREYRLLLQLDLGIQQQLGIQVGRSVYFSIREQDLSRCDFTQVWVDLS